MPTPTPFHDRVWLAGPPGKAARPPHDNGKRHDIPTPRAAVLVLALASQKNPIGSPEMSWMTFLKRM